VYLLKFRRETGAIETTWHASTEEILRAQVVEDDPLYGYLLSDTETTADELQRTWRVEDGTLVAKAQLRLTATQARFLADGVAESAITVEPFVPCTLLIDLARYRLTDEDSTLIITALGAKVFVVQLDTMASHWAEPLVLEAY
jgi:hypothetical protein